MTTPDYPDWTQPVAQLETTAALPIPGNLVPINGSAVDVDTSGLQSVTLAVHLPNTAAGNRYGLSATWIESGIEADVQSMTFHSINSYNGLPFRLFWQLPCRGNTLELEAVGPAAGNLSVDGLGSSRTVADARISVGQLGLGKLLQSVSTGSIPASGSAGPYYIPPVSDKVGIAFALVTSKMLFNVSGVYANASAITVAILARQFGGNIDGVINPLYAPGVGLEVGLNNLDTSAASPSFQVWDAS